MMKRQFFRKGAAAFGVLGAISLLFAAPAQEAAAQSNSYPARDITLVVPYAPGATADLIGRKYAALLGSELGVTVVVENTPGGSGTMGAVKVFGAKPDGYTLGYGHNSPLAIQPHTNPGLPYKSVDDFSTIGGFGHQPATVSVNSASEWKTFDDFVKAAKAAPGDISIAVGSAGNVKDLQLRQFQKAADVEFNIVPFAGGGAEAVMAVLGKVVDGVSVNSSTVAGQIAAGELLPLAMFAETDGEEVSGFRLIKASAYPGLTYLADSWGIIAPKGLPEDVLKILDDTHQKIMKDKDFLAALEADSFIVVPTNSEEYKAQLKGDFDSFGAILAK